MSQPVKVLHLTHDMGIGGTEQVIKQLISGLDPLTVACSVLCLDGEVGALGRQLQEQGIAVDTLYRRPGFDSALIRAIRKVLRERRIDVLHCHQYTPYTYGVIAAMFTGVRVVYTEHGRFHPDRYTWKRRLLNPLLNLATDSITAISQATRQALIHFEWFSAGAIQVIYNGIRDHAAGDPQAGGMDVEGDAEGVTRSRLRLPEDAIVFGTIARLDTIKNHRMMLDAFSAVCQRQTDARLLIVGDGPERAALEHHASELGLADVVTFTGFQTDTPRYLALMDAFLLSSFSEGTSMTLLEAMSFRKPCLATAVGGNVELLEHRESGLLSASGATDEFADAMRALGSDAELRRSLGQNAREVFLARFELSYMIEAYQRLYLSSMTEISL